MPNKAPSGISTILLQRLWQGGSGLVTLGLVATCLSPDQQGWYYSFLALGAVYTLFDFGLSIALIQVSAHFFVGGSWGKDGGAEGQQRDRIVALLGMSMRRYLLLALLFICMMVPVGMIFFGSHQEAGSQPEASWAQPWIVLVLSTGASMILLPFLSILEGSGRIAEAYAIRLGQGVAISLTTWVMLLAGGSLWAPALAPLAGLTIGMGWLALSRPAILKDANPRKTGLDWSREVGQFQFRVGIGWLANFMLYQIYTPVLFRAQGSVVAGQMGLSLTIVNMLSLISLSWLTQFVPSMSQAAANRDWVGMDQLFRRGTRLSVGLFLLGTLGLCLAYLLLQHTPYADRILPAADFFGLLLVTFIAQVVGALSIHLRSYRKEPLAWVTVLGAALTAPAAIWAAPAYSSNGVVLAMLAVQAGLILPMSVWLWRRFNRRWRHLN